MGETEKRAATGLGYIVLCLACAAAAVALHAYEPPGDGALWDTYKSRLSLLWEFLAVLAAASAGIFAWNAGLPAIVAMLNGEREGGGHG